VSARELLDGFPTPAQATARADAARARIDAAVTKTSGVGDFAKAAREPKRGVSPLVARARKRD
jgi:hypothetical protein